MNVIESWQKGPLKIMGEAIRYNEKGNEEDRFLSFLLLDVGMEMVLKTYLSLPKSFTGAVTSEDERFLASRKGWHDVMEAVKQSRQGISAHDLGQVSFFHGIRNKLYHQGNGITVPKEHVNDYIDVAARLTKSLLKMDIFSILKPNELTEEERERVEKCKELVDENLLLAKQLRARLTNNYELAAEKISQDLVVPSFKRRFEKIIEKSLTEDEFYYNEVDNEVIEYKTLPRNTSGRLKLVNDLKDLCNDIFLNSGYKDLFLEPHVVDGWGSVVVNKTRTPF